MQEVLYYLELKNQFYEKFYTVTLKFFEQVSHDQWNDVQLFVDNRDRILNIIHSYDHKITEHFKNLKLSQEEIDSHRAKVKEILDIKAALAKKIVSLDLELVSLMEEVKNDTIKSLKKSLETAQQVGSFTPPLKRSAKPRQEV
jgi:CRISPR/Cas system-associated exonuclease Cas4 (RecB family)